LLFTLLFIVLNLKKKILLTLFTIILYCLSALLIFKQSSEQSSSIVNQRWFSLTPALLALALHAYTLNNNIYLNSGINLSLFTSASLVSWLVSLQILLASIKRPVDSLGIVMFPLSAMAIALEYKFMSAIVIGDISSGVQSHILISIVAYSLLMLGSLQAVALAFQHKSFKNHHPTGLVKKLPPLQDMESFLFQILSFSFIFLSLALLSGFLFFDDLFAQHLVHKTILSLIGWGSLFTLLIGRFLFGWRGKVAIRWTFISFGFILLAYFGSKFVLEILIKA